MSDTWLEDQLKDPKFRKLYSKEYAKLAKEWREKQLKWCSLLVPGDIVHTCSRENKVIKEITTKFCVPAWVVRLTVWLPFSWEDKIIVFAEKHFPAISNYDIEFEDGSFCSGVNCCSPVELCPYEMDIEEES